ncbi:MAG: translocation/assembly module TamB domain-containing protein [Thermoanaerobaculales bacterium]|jgi:hypothetical protein|nr:translocation/assembly module TamB domain-containing protein [Thermoanaerobaculales bacterium]
MGRARRLRYRHLRRTVIAVLATVAALLLVASVAHLLLTAGPTRRLARNWIEGAAARRGLTLEIEDLGWAFLPPRVELEGLRLAGPGFGAEIDRAEVELTRFWLARRTIELGTVVADGVRLSLTDPPRPEPRGGDRLKLRVRHLQLTRFEFVGTGLPGRVDLTLDGMDAGWSSEGGPPAGFVRVDRVELKAPGLRPVEVSAEARLVLDDGVEIPSWRVRADGVDLRGRGSVTSAGGTSFTAAGTVELAALDQVVKAGNILEGTVTVAATLTPGAEEPLRLEAEGRRLRVAGFPLEDVAGRLVLVGNGMRGELDRATLHGGRIAGGYTLERKPGELTHRVLVTGRGVRVADLLRSLKVPPAGIAAQLDADVDVGWSGRAFPLGHGRAEVLLRPTAGPLPASGPLTIELDGDRALTFSADELQLGGTMLDWQGPLAMGSWQPAWSFTASPAVLEEIVPMVNGFIGSAALPPVEGVARLQVGLSGPWRELVVRTRIDARPLRLGRIEIDHLVASALVASRELTLGPSNFSLGDGSGEIDGAMSWDPEDGDRQLAIDLRGHRIPMARLAQWIGQDGMVDGVLSFTGGLRGPLASPRGAWAVGLDDVRLAGVDLGDATATVDLSAGRFEARGLDFDRGLGGRLWWQPVDGEVGADLGWQGMPLDFLGDEVVRTVGPTADLRVAGRLSGDRRPLGALEAASTDGRLEIRAEPDHWLVEGRLADAVNGSIELRPAPGGGLAGGGRLELDSAEGLIARLLPDSGVPLTGTAGLDLRVDWPTGSAPIVDATLAEVDLRLQDDPVRLLGPAHLRLSSDGLEVEDLYLGHRNDRVFFRWKIAADGTIRGNATGTLDALLLRFLVPDWEPAGRATGVVEVLGTLERPRLEGIAEIAQGSFRLPGGQTILSGIDGTVLLSEDEVVVDGAGFRFMQGRGVADGRIARREGVVSLDLAGDMTGLRYPVLPGLEARLSGPWRIAGPTDELHISGDLRVERGTLQRRDDPAALILEWFGGPPTPPGEGGASLDLRVDADQTIELRNPFVRLVGSASLHVTGTTNRPGVVGKVEFEEGGEVTLQNLRYDVERASLTFSDPDRIDPSVELQLRTWVQNYQVTLRISGTSDRLIPQVSSNPPLPQEEVFSLLAMGYRSDTLGSGAMGVGIASTLLSQQLSTELDRRTKLVLPQFRVDPFSDSTASGPSARVTVVQQLSPSWTVTLQSNLSAERAEVIVSRWYLAPGIFLEASRQLDGSYGVDIKMRRPY